MHGICEANYIIPTSRVPPELLGELESDLIGGAIKTHAEPISGSRIAPHWQTRPASSLLPNPDWKAFRGPEYN